MFKTSNIGIAIKNRQLNSTGPKKLTLTKDNSFLVFPFNLIAGYITSTENGLRSNDNVEIGDYSNFQRIFTGLENMIAQWDGAYNVEKKDPADTFLTKEYKEGRNFRAFIPNETMGASFEPSSISSDFLAEYTDEEFIMHSYDDIEEKDLFKLFIIPELREYKWLYISNAERYFHNGKFHHIEITMTTLNNKVAKSGGSIESFIQRSAPGEGYAWPVVGINQTVSLDEVRKKDVPITSGQIEISGPAAINTIVAYGRPTIQKTENGITQSTFNPKVEAPRLLLPLRLETPIPSPENTRPSAETDFYVGYFQPTQQDSYKDWKAQFAGSYDLQSRSNFEGVLISSKTLDELRASNPLDALGTHTKELWDNSWTVNINKTYNTKPNNLTGDQLALNGDYKIGELLSHQFFATSHISTLPQTVQQNIAWSLHNIPIIGGFLSKLTLGIPIGWNDLAIRLAMSSVELLMPSSLAEYGNVLKGDGSADTKVWIPIETFTGERKDEIIENSGINATGTIIKTQFTHRFSKTIDGVEYVFDTKDLGQTHPTTDDNGKAIPNTPTGTLMWDETCKPTNRGPNTPGYVIDLTHSKILAKLDYRQTFFSNDIQAWTGTYQTKAKFTNTTREWVNSMKMSHWVETNNKIVEYPKTIVAPNPPNSNYPKIRKDTNYIFNIMPTDQYNPATYFDFFRTIGLLEISNGYAFNKDHFSQFALKYGAEQTFDFAQFGGTTALKNNYDFLEFNVKVNNTNEAIKVNLNELITAGSKAVYLSQSTIRRITAVANNVSGTNNHPFEMTYSYKEMPILIMTVSGNELKIRIDWSLSGDIVSKEFQSKINKITAVPNRPDWNSRAGANIISITAIPKTIV